MLRTRGNSTAFVVVLAAFIALQSAVVVFAQSSGCGPLANITAVEDPAYLFIGQELNVTFTVWDVASNGSLNFQSNSDFHFTVQSPSEYLLATSDALPRNITVTILGKALSLEQLTARFSLGASSGAASANAAEVAAVTIGVKRIPTLLSALAVYIIIVWIILGYLSMGGSMDFKEIWQRVRRPYGVLIGLFCQFIIMPALSFLTAHLLAAGDNTTAVGMVLVGTTPGGWLSNLLTVLLNGDLVLSVTMTFFSNVFALFMMPLNLLIYATPFTGANQRLRTPFVDIIIQLAILVVPLFIGIGLSYKFRKFRKFSEKIVKPLSSVVIIFAIGLTVPAELYAFTQSPINIWGASILIPAFGAFFGLSFARIFARNIRSSVTISIETGVQNALLGRTIVYLSYPQPEADLVTRVVLTVVLITFCEGVFAAIVFSCFRYVFCKRKCDTMKWNKDEEEDEVVVGGDDNVGGTAVLDYGSPSKNGPNNGKDNMGYQNETSAPL